MDLNMQKLRFIINSWECFFSSAYIRGSEDMPQHLFIDTLDSFEALELDMKLQMHNWQVTFDIVALEVPRLWYVVWGLSLCNDP